MDLNVLPVEMLSLKSTFFDPLMVLSSSLRFLDRQEDKAAGCGIPPYEMISSHVCGLGRGAEEGKSVCRGTSRPQCFLKDHRDFSGRVAMMWRPTYTHGYHSVPGWQQWIAALRKVPVSCSLTPRVH